MNQTLLAGGNLHKSAEVHQPGYTAGVVGTGLRIIDNGVDNGHGALALLLINAGDKHMSILFHIHLDLALGADLLDDFSAGADNFADLLHRDHGREHLRCILRQLGARLGNGLEQDLVDDIVTGHMGLVQSLFDDFRGQTRDFQVHLNSGNTLVGTGHLEVHIAEEVLDALDVHHGHPAVALGDQATGDTGHRRLDRNTGVHQGQGAAADRTLGSGAVGGQHLRDQAQRIGEFLHAGDHGQQGALCQGAMADLAAAGAAAGLGLAHRIGGEVVVVNIALFGLAVDAVQHLGIADRAQGGHGQHLGLAAGEQTGAVYAGQQAHFGGQRADFIHLAAVHALLLIQQPAAHDELLGLIHALVNLRFLTGIQRVEVLVYFFINGLQALIADGLIVRIHGQLYVLHRKLLHGLEHIVVGLVARIGELLLADLLLDALDKLDDLLVALMTGHNAVEHILVAHLIGAGLDHRHPAVRRGHGHCHLADLALLLGGVHHELAIHQAHRNAADRAVPRDIGNTQGDGRTDHGRDLRRAVGIHAHHRADDGHIVAHILGEQRADRAVNHTADQNGLIRGTALPFQERTRNTAHRIQLLLKIHGQREEVHTVTGFSRGRRGHMHHGLAIADQALAVGQLAHFAGFHNQRTACEFGLEYAILFKHAFSSIHFCLLLLIQESNGREKHRCILAIKPKGSRSPPHGGCPPRFTAKNTALPAKTFVSDDGKAGNKS